MREVFARLGLLLLRAIAKLPIGFVRPLGERLGDLLWLVARKRKRVALVNLGLCFPHWSEARTREVAHAHFRAFAASFLERFIIWFEPPERLRRIVELRGGEHYEAVRGKPVILLAPHFMGLDAGGLRFQLDYGGASIYARQKSRVLTEAMVRGRTRFHGAQTLLRNEGLRPAIRVLRAGIPLYILPDMDLGRRDAVFVPFFGVPAATVTSVARLASLTGAAVVPVVTKMVPGGYVATIGPAWEGFPGDDLEAATRRMNEYIEGCVLEMPEQYLWSHRRFKTRPEGEPDVYGDAGRGTDEG